MDAGCIVLAGGRGTRLGRDKICEIVGDKSLLQQVLACVGQLSDDTIVVTAKGRSIPPQDGQPGFRLVTDIFPEKGPLGGIYTGLVASRYHRNLVVACDMPFLNQGLLRYMLELSSDFDLVVPRVGDLHEPLHAVYTRSCLAPIESLLRRGRLSILELFHAVRVRYVTAEEIDRFDPERLSFFNINTGGDLDKARELARNRGVCRDDNS